MVHLGFDAPIRELAQAGFPIGGTCAGMILLAKDIGGLRQPLIGVMDVVVERNAFGRQTGFFRGGSRHPGDWRGAVSCGLHPRAAHP